MTDDIEKTLKNFVNSPEAPAGIHLSADEIKVMLERLVSYRKRINAHQQKHDIKIGKLHRELADLRRSIKWARDRLDSEGLGTHYSFLDQVETALLVEAIEKRRGRIIAQRMLWGKPPEETLAQETIGVLKGAIENAKKERAHWHNYLEEQRKHAIWRRCKDWMDWDAAAYELGCVLDLFSRKLHPFATKAKHVFWSDNPVGNALHECLNQLVKAGIMERREEPDTQFRWSPEFKGTWE